jgi:hypothetical protein
MPRKNNAIKHIPFRPPNHEAGKTRFATKRQADDAAEYQMLINPGLELFVYQSNTDGGWYLTRQAPIGT